MNKKYLTAGETVTLELPYSEVCMHMGVAGQVMTVLLTLGRYPMAQLIKGGRPFSFPVTTGEAGIFTEHSAGGSRYYCYPPED